MRLTPAIILVSGAVATAAFAVAGDGGGDVRALAAAAKSKGHVRIHGKVGGLAPGLDKTLRVHVRNTAGRQMWVKAVATEVGDASPSCTSDYLFVEQKEGRHRRVPPRSHRRIKLSVRLDPSTPDVCQGASWPLDYQVRVKRK
jgi:hypothetical protein